MPSPQKHNEFLYRPLRICIILGSTVLFAFFVWSAAEARKRSSDRIVDWMPRGSQELITYRDRYQAHFAEGEYLMVSWKGCTTNDERLDILAEKLVASQGDAADGEAYFARTMTTRSVIANLQEVIPRLSDERAKDRLIGWLIGEDREKACLVLVPNPSAWRASPAAAVEFLLTTIEEVTELPRSDIYVAGPSIDSVAISAISKKSQQTLLPFFLLFSLFLLFCCLRHYFAALLVFWVALINEELAGTLLYWFGAHVDSVSMLNASLVYVLTISGSVHLMNYYRKTLSEMQPGDDYRSVPMLTFRKAILPCSLAAFTTILGIGSLAISQMVPIRTFGTFASLALFLGTIWFFLCILSVLQERPIKRWFPKRNDDLDGCDDKAGNHPPGSPQPTGNFWERFGLVIYYFRYPITLLTFLSLIIFAFGIKDLRTSVTFHGLLPKDAKVLQDYRMLEENIGGLIPIEVVVQFPYSDWQDRRLLDQLHFIDALADELWVMEHVDAVVSALNFLPHLPSQTDGGRAVTQRAALEGILERNQDRLRSLRFSNNVENILDHIENCHTAHCVHCNTFEAFVIEAHHEKRGENARQNAIIHSIERYNSEYAGTYWRLSLRISTQKRLNYADLTKEVKDKLEAIRQANEEMNVESVRFDVTGGVPLVQQAQHMLLWDLIYSFIMAFGLIALTMIIILRGLVRGLLAMIPNVFPCVIVFGLLGLCGIPVDMGSMMTASVALGISVDGTLHLLTWVNTALRRGMARKEAVLYALQRCSTALTQTMIICGVGMLVFVLSDFVPVARFALLLGIILLISLVGAIVALPAILFSPLGRFFEGHERDRKKNWLL
ncbi:MAG: MMPL family transporter [Planctomycetaceae bacterium]|nr:MMPL family transporter [Planctomycetaceae bacterium]